jgi:predicted transcriptional regulator
MPGDRLSLRERRDIESGMTAGHGYAEIARRLRRPTSTISREVSRNGGHNHYRADHAHQLAGGRARRNSPRPAAHAAGSRTAHGAEDPTDSARRAAEHRLVEMMAAAGLPRMMASVLVALLLSDHGVLSAADLVGRLQVSPASISKAVRHLEHLRFVRRERRAGTRREQYVLDEDMWAGLWAARNEAMGTWGAGVREAAAQLGVTTAAGARLDQMSRFLAFMHQEMDRATDRWRLVNPPAEPAAASSPRSCSGSAD